MFSIIIPVYKNEASLPELVASLAELAREVWRQFGRRIEVVFVVDGSPDESHRILQAILPDAPFRSRLLLHTRNFGSFAAIRSGLEAATGELFGVMAADLQDPPELMLQFLSALHDDECDVVVGTRKARNDPLPDRILSRAFWWLYRRFVIPEIPRGGVDVFGCNLRFRDELLKLGESNSSLVGLIFWLGFKRQQVSYERRERKHGRSAWTFRRKLKYLLDSVFSFTDLPIRILIGVGIVGIAAAVIIGTVILFLRLFGAIDVPGYTATVLIVLFFGGLNAFGLGIVGAYAWRGFENTKQRPLALVMRHQQFEGRSDVDRLDRPLTEQAQ